MMSPISAPMNGRTPLPDDIYSSLVRSLYGDPKTLIVGSAGTIAACLITWIKTWEVSFLLCTLALVIVSLLRALDMRAFRRTEGAAGTPDDARNWEMRYVVASALYVLIMGIWCFIAFTRATDAMVQLLSFSMTLVNMIGVAGRNFGSKKLVAAQLICAGVPMILGLFWIGDASYAVCACVLAPFFVSFKTIADHLRATLTGATTAARDVQLLADRLDTALNNMSHGLCMVDHEGAIVIANERLPEILGVDPKRFRAGEPAETAFAACVRARLFNSADFRRVIVGLQARLSGDNQRPLTIPIRGERTLTLTARGMQDGSSVVLVEDVTEQRRADAKISHLAHYDSLTGLQNRSYFREEIERILSQPGRQTSFAVHFIDLDEFKLVNDTLGHPAGDELLKLVANRLRMLAKATDVIARLGGDEFVVIQLPLEDPEHAAAFARGIVETLGRPYDVDGHAVIVGASVGISLSPGDGCDADILLKNADMALYRAKSEGRGTWRFFEIGMDIRARARRALELDLRVAIAEGRLELHYQPILDLRSRRVGGCEALLRWFDPERGAVSPSEFVPIAEEMGLINEIGTWVLKTACRAAMTWPAGTNVAVNLSPIQFRHGDVVAAVRDALAASGLEAHRLEVEITESVLLQDSVSTLASLQHLRKLGVRISLDDFGTGFSSLSYLRKFPLQKVKIDQSFLVGIKSDLKLQILLRGIARLCGELGLSVLIEGVETEDQLDLVMDIAEVTQVQGFLFAKPAPAARTRELLFALGGDVGRSTDAPAERMAGA